MIRIEILRAHQRATAVPLSGHEWLATLDNGRQVVVSSDDFAVVGR
jgi:hypothetical protein